MQVENSFVSSKIDFAIWSGKRKDIKLRDHSTKDALNSLLAKYEFERSG